MNDTAPTRELVAKLEADNAELKQRVQQLSERERHLRAILDAEPECVKSLAADGTLLEMNRAGLAMIEADSSEQVIGRCIYPLVVAEHRAAFQALTERVFRGQPGTLEFEFVGLKDGRRWLETHATPLRSESGEVLSLLSVTRDITERKLTETRLRESERRFSTLYRVLPVGTCISRFADGVFLDMNEAFAKITGHTREELLGRSSLDVTYWLDPEDRVKLVQALADNGFVRDWEVGFRRKDGSVGHSLRSLERLTLDGEDCILTVLSDITERKRMEQELQDGAASLAAAQERAKMGSWELDLATQTGWWSHGMFRLFDRDMALGTPTFPEFLELVHPDDRQSMLDSQRESIEDGQDATGEFRLNPLHGAPRHFRYSIHCLRDERGDTVRLAGTLQDITERKRTDDELVQSRERLEILSRQLISTQESERRHLSRELHDEIGQELTSIKLNLKNLTRVSPEGTDLIHDTLAIAEHALQQVRSLALDLRPSMLDDIGLAAALRWCLDRQAHRAGFHAQFFAMPPEIATTPEIAITCFRVVQESLTNIARHAHARNVRVEVHQYETALDLQVHDDGIGFDVTAATDRATRGASLGLLGMRERAELAGGLIDIESTPDSGTTIHARFPLGGKRHLFSESAGTR